jgi:DNA-binding GntR family transcriptional regulator
MTVAENIHYFTPLWQRLAEHICRMIMQGEYGENEILQEPRALAATLEVNIHTMEPAVKTLLEHGVLIEKNGRLSIASSVQAAAYLKDAFLRDTVPQISAQMSMLKITAAQMCEFLENYTPVSGL